MRDDFRVNLATIRERYVEADVRAFFHSIYTHAIPWAIYGKEFAKVNRGQGHYGNLLDLYCRNAQDGQTIGLPVGPDTSRIIAEVVASAMDNMVIEILGVSSSDASRYVDDYTIAVKPGYSGDRIISAVRQAATEYELELNNEKSSIKDTTERASTGWKQAVLAHVPRDDLSSNSFLRFFYEIGRVCREQPELNVEKFALQNARSALINAEDWPTLQNHLITAYCRNPSIVSLLVEVIILRQVEADDVNLNGITDFLGSRLNQLALENRSGEIIWLLFLLIRLELTIPANKIEALYELENSMVALLVTYAAHRGHISGPIDSSYWEKWLSEEGLRSPMWLYAYESVRNGTNPNGDRTFIETDPFFRLLLGKNIKFFEPSQGFTSINSALRARRGENIRANVLRADYSDDLEVDLMEFDADDLPDSFPGEY